MTVFAVAVAVCCLILARAERTSREAAKLEEAVAAVNALTENILNPIIACLGGTEVGLVTPLGNTGQVINCCGGMNC